MPLPIVSRVFSLVHGFESITGMKPKVLYVGEVESKEIENLIQGGEVVMDSVKYTPPRSRTEFVGFPVYKVDAESYLACG